MKFVISRIAAAVLMSLMSMPAMAGEYWDPVTQTLHQWDDDGRVILSGSQNFANSLGMNTDTTYQTNCGGYSLMAGTVDCNNVGSYGTTVVGNGRQYPDSFYDNDGNLCMVNNQYGNMQAGQCDASHFATGRNSVYVHELENPENLRIGANGYPWMQVVSPFNGRLVQAPATDTPILAGSAVPGGSVGRAAVVVAEFARQIFTRGDVQRMAQEAAAKVRMGTDRYEALNRATQELNVHYLSSDPKVHNKALGVIEQVRMELMNILPPF
jgi:hypothetical protein